MSSGHLAKVDNIGVRLRRQQHLRAFVAAELQHEHGVQAQLGARTLGGHAAFNGQRIVRNSKPIQQRSTAVAAAAAASVGWAVLAAV